MPPKQQQKQGSSSKPKDDKTFGMKNKNKSAKVQKQVAIIQDQQSRAGKNKALLDKEKEKDLRAKAKLDEEKRKRDEADLFKPVAVQQKVPFGVDPKTVLCQFFKAGHCEKGTKCKFSHNLEVERKTQKKDLYSDARDEDKQDTMENWDEEKLRTVVLSKAGNPRTTTDIVCKFFIEAVESARYGWFWECPNGESCMYRHALPPGFVLRSQKKALDEANKANTISLEEFLEVERHKLGTNLTPVTPETFAVWKRTRMNKKEAEAEAMKKAKDTAHAAGKVNGMSGRDLFSFNPDWFEDEDEGGDEWDIAKYRQETEAEDALAEEARLKALNEGFQADGQDTEANDTEVNDTEPNDIEPNDTDTKDTETKDDAVAT